MAEWLEASRAGGTRDLSGLQAGLRNVGITPGAVERGERVLSWRVTSS